MVALRSFDGLESDVDGLRRPGPIANAADWLPLQQAACELGVSPATARRMIRRGQLRNRMVPRPGGFAYLVYLPNSRHAAVGLTGQHAVHALRPSPSGRSAVQRVEAKFARLSRSLSLALRQRHQPASSTRAADGAGPFARYRWLARKRRWWRF
jgi:hypothetical protein